MDDDMSHHPQLSLDYARDRLLIKIAQGLEVLLVRADAIQTSTQVEAAEILFVERLDELFPDGPETQS